MKTKLEQSLECVVNVFHRYCILNPMDDYLQPKEFQKMLKEEAQVFLKRTTPPNLDEDAYIKQLFQRADRDKNGFLKFSEFLYTFASVLDDSHVRSHELGDDDAHKTPGHGHGHSHSHGHGHGH